MNKSADEPFENTSGIAAHSVIPADDTFRRIFDQAPDPVYLLTGADMILEAANEPLFRTWQAGKEIIGKPLRDIRLGVEQREFYRSLTEVFTNGGVARGIETPIAISRPDGTVETVFFDYTCQPFRDAAGNVTGVLVFAHDVTGQVHDRFRLRESEDRFQTLAASLPQLVWMTDEKGNYDYVNSQWKKYSGLDFFSSGEPWQKMVHLADMPPMMNAWIKSLGSGDPYCAEARLRNRAGEYRWHSVLGEPIRDEEKKIIRWIGAFTDIHDRKTMNEELEKLVLERTSELTILNEKLKEKNNDLADSEAFLQQLIDSSVEYISVADTQLNYIAVNKTFEQGIGISRSELIGKNLLEINPEALHTQQYESVLRALKGQTTYLDKRQSVAKQECYVDTYFIPLTRQGKISGVIILSRDVTDIVRSERLLEQKNIQLERSNEDLQQFAGVVSHDLKEPLRKIRIYGGFLKLEAEKKLSEQGKQQLEKIEAASVRMHNMIDGILYYSTLQASELEFEAVNVNELLRNIESDLEVVIQKKHAQIRYDRLPVLTGSPVLLHQLFYNLINNALKFSHEGIAPVITLTSTAVFQKNEPAYNREQVDEYTVITVQDNGIGFQPSDAKRIFNTFSRLHNKKKYEGTGLGLALCKKITERHGGRIEAEGTEGSGAIFRMYMPVKHD